jgi:hypothetical protein
MRKKKRGMVLTVGDDVFCSLKKQTLKTFVVFKKRTLQTFLVNGLWIVVFCIQSISKLCSQCSTFCSLL